MYVCVCARVRAHVCAYACVGMRACKQPVSVSSDDGAQGQISLLPVYPSNLSGKVEYTQHVFWEKAVLEVKGGVEVG